MKKYISSSNSFNKASTIIALSIILGTVTYAWTGPTATAPNNNTSAPINVSATTQTKSGGLGLGVDILPGERLRVLGDATFTGKAYSSPTIESDPSSSLVTKGYLDSKVDSSGVGAACNSTGIILFNTGGGRLCCYVHYSTVSYGLTGPANNTLLCSGY